jgi:hypothetical protein
MNPRTPHKLELVINTCFGGFDLSDSACLEYTARTSRKVDAYDMERDDPVLVQIVKELGSRANGIYSKLSIRRIPAQYAKFYTIHEYDGNESVEIHYDAYRVAAAKAILKDAHLTRMERIARATAVLGADLEAQDMVEAVRVGLETL